MSNHTSDEIAGRGVVLSIRAAALAAIVTVAAAAGCLFATPLASAAELSPLWTAGKEGSGAGQTSMPRGVAASPQVPGNVYVADQNNQRISVFNPWGEFIRAWGWGVRDGSPELQVCTAATGCQAGAEGDGPGAFKSPQGVAVDAAGDVFVVDWLNNRVQKFDSEGNFLLMFGGGVNQGPSNPGNLCTAQHLTEGDACGAGTTGSGPGEFGPRPVYLGSWISADPAGNVSVGDRERIMRFTSGGVFIEALEPPSLLDKAGEEPPSPVEGIAGKGFVRALAQDADGNYYVGIEAELPGFMLRNEIQKLSPTGASLCTISILGSAHFGPLAVAVDREGTVYVFKEGTRTIERFDGDNCANLADPFTIDPFVPNLLVTGIGTGSGCHSSGASIYVTNAVGDDSFLRAYGSSPDNDVDCPPPPRPPAIDAQFATAVDADSAVLKAQINPRFWRDTSYYVEYGLGECSAGECDRIVNFPGVGLDSGVVDEPVVTTGVPLTGLSSATTYHYRFVAESSGGGPVHGLEGTFTTMPPSVTEPDGCANAAFRVGAATQLPDCRAYEMVSPVDKQSSDVLALVNNQGILARRDRAAASGAAMTYASYRAFEDSVSAPYTSQYLATRTEAGWSNRSISPPRLGGTLTGAAALDSQYITFSENLSQGWLIQDAEPVLAPGGVAGFINAYRRDNETGGYTALSTEQPVNTPAEDYYLEIVGTSGDGAHTVFVTNDHQTAGKPVMQIYDSLNGSVAPVCILPSKARSPQPCSLGTNNSGVVPNHEGSIENAISDDGSRIYWISTAAAAGSGPGRIFLRLNRSATLPVSDLAGAGNGARFLTAAADGSKAIFSVDKNGAEKLYEYDLATKSVEEIAGDVIGVAGASADASRVYLASSEALDDGAQAGAGNLYLYEAGESPEFELVATLPDVDVDLDSGNPLLSPVNPKPRYKVSRVSADGNHLVFMSRAPLTGAENLDAQSDESLAEVFLYDAAEDSLVCVSCNRTGARPSGRNIRKEAKVNADYWAAGQIPLAEGQIYTSRILSAAGTRVFFESFQPLVLADTNGKQDVYQWEEVGAGGCRETQVTYDPASGGCVSLISGGESPEDAEILDASADGSDVFFTTSASLVAHDPGLVDVYDARVLGGFPPPTPTPRRCEGESCQGAPVAPTDPTPASALFRGAGNAPATRDCTALARRAKRLARKAKARRSARLESKAKRAGKGAKRCRIDNRRKGR